MWGTFHLSLNEDPWQQDSRFGHGGPREGVRSAGVGHEVCPRIHERGISRRHEDRFGGDQEGAVGKQCGDHHTWMEIVHVVAEDVALQTTPRRTYSAQEVRRKVGGIQRW